MKVNRFKHAIAKKPSKSMVNGLTSAFLGKPNYNLSLYQHENYIRSLKKCGVHIEILDENENYPDSCFIEDVAICTPKCAIITNPGAASRKGEVVGIDKILKKYYDNIASISPDGTVEGGDIMMVGNHYYIGISERTNHSGADQLIAILESYGYSGTKVPLKKVLHLKTGLSYLENNKLLISGEFVDDPLFKDFDKIIIDPPETYAVNSLWVNGFVITPAGFPQTLKKIEAAGYETIPVDVSEFQKLDGGLSCLSLRF